ncbi:MAG: dihydroorotase, partial [Lachnospiraceae bacterium]|nr:dihydroorotase [Lachnospiraceae bacterium]
MLKIQNAQVCDPVNKLSGRYDVTIENGEIADLNEATGKIDEGAIDASDYILTLGLCDVHVHFR